MQLDQNLFGKTKLRQSNLRIIAGMEVPVPIGAETAKPLSENYLIWTWSNNSMKYQCTQYYHIMDHKGRYKYFLNFYERVTCITKSLGDILKEESKKHNFWLEWFKGNYYEQYTTTVTNSQNYKDDVTKGYIKVGLNAAANLISL